MPKIIITGGPGSGKSTLLEALGRRGFLCVPEVSREIIREQVGLGTHCLPWKDLESFAGLCLEKMMSDFELADGGLPVFYDRGIPDIVAYLKIGNVAALQNFMDATIQFKYAKMVFIAPPWQAIYVNDSERWQTFQESEILHHQILCVYAGLGYQLIDLPLTSVEERVEFVLRKLNVGEFDGRESEHIRVMRLSSSKT